jgi:DNA-binding MarR family transcriptional regulator
MSPDVVTDGVRQRVTSPRADLATNTAQDPAASVPAPAGAGGAPADSEAHQVWRQYLRGHAAVARALEAELLVEQRLSLAAYDVLAQLGEAPQRRLRMTELAEAVLLSRSGVTRMVDRLERLGLVSRGRVVGDGRGIAATLTEQGLDQLRRASVTHVAAVRRYFVGRLHESDLRELRRISQRLATGPSVPSADGIVATV